MIIISSSAPAHLNVSYIMFNLLLWLYVIAFNLWFYVVYLNVSYMKTPVTTLINASPTMVL